MGIIEIIEEIVMTHELCKSYDECDILCPHYNDCMEVFGKDYPIDEIEKLAAQCKAFNEFARANRKGNK